MRSTVRYKLTVGLRISEVDERGYEMSGNRLTVEESLELNGVESFMEIASVLGRFHELAKEIELGSEQEQAERDPEQALAAWALVKRDDAVRIAHAGGVNKNRIHTITGIARTTIDRILAGLPDADA